MKTRNQGQMPPKRHEKLMHEALQEFAVAGYEQASLNRILRQCGISKSSFYHYFVDKEALFERLVRESSAALIDQLKIPQADSLTGEEMWDVLAGLMRRLHELSATQPEFVMFGRMLYQPDIPAGEGSAIRHVREAVSHWLGVVLERGQQHGIIRTDLPRSLLEELAFAMLQTMDQWSVQHLDEFSGDNGDRLMVVQLAVIRRMLEPDVSATDLG